VRVLVALDVADRPLGKIPERVPRLRVQRPQVLLLHLPVALHLLDDQLRVADELDLVRAELLGKRDAEQQGAVLRDVVGGFADGLAAFGQLLA
jgi:hypothetical protein